MERPAGDPAPCRTALRQVGSEASNTHAGPSISVWHQPHYEESPFRRDCRHPMTPIPTSPRPSIMRVAGSGIVVSRGKLWACRVLGQLEIVEAALSPIGQAWHANIGAGALSPATIFGSARPNGNDASISQSRKIDAPSTRRHRPFPTEFISPSPTHRRQKPSRAQLIWCPE